MKNLIFITFLSPLLIFAQQKESFKIELQSSYRTYNLVDFNKLVNDAYYVGSADFDQVALKGGMSYGLALSFPVMPVLSLGLYGEHQRSSANQKNYEEYEYQPGYSVQLVGLRKYNIQSYGVGLNANLILNKLSFWANSARFSKFESSFNLQAGYGKGIFSSSSEMVATEQMNVHNAGIELYKGVYTANGFQLLASLKLGYVLSDQNYFSSIGFKVGYQYFLTSSLTQGSDKREPILGRETKLDLSGLTAGIYLTLGR